MTARKAITKKLAVDALLHRVFLQFGSYLKCSISGEDMKPLDRVQFDHIHAHALDGPHVYDNLRPVLVRPHQKKTKEDLRKIKKTRPGHADKFVVNKGRDGDGYLGGSRGLAPQAVSVVAPEQKSLTSPVASMRSSAVANAEIGNEPSPLPKPTHRWPKRPFNRRA